MVNQIVKINSNLNVLSHFGFWIFGSNHKFYFLLLDSESDIDSSSEDGMDDQGGRGNGVKLGSSSSERSVEKRPRKKPGHPNRDRAGPKQNLAKAVAAPMVPKLLPPPPPQPAVRTERLPSLESEKG